MRKLWKEKKQEADTMGEGVLEHMGGGNVATHSSLGPTRSPVLSVIPVPPAAHQGGPFWGTRLDSLSLWWTFLCRLAWSRWQPPAQALRLWDGLLSSGRTVHPPEQWLANFLKSHRRNLYCFAGHMLTDTVTWFCRHSSKAPGAIPPRMDTFQEKFS